MRNNLPRRITTLCSAAVIAGALAGIALSVATRDWSAIGWQITTIGGFTVALITMERR